MSKAFNALYENGVFKPLVRVRLKNKQRVKLTVIEQEKLPKQTAKSRKKQRAKSKSADIASHPSQQIVGLFRSGVHNLSKNHDRYLYR